MSKTRDKDLGMDRAIARRDFLQGAAVGLTALGTTTAVAADAEPQNAPGYYPPAKMGIRGSHPGAFEAAHEVRDGAFWDKAHSLEDTHEAYDLVVVGGGISGLAAAHFYRAGKPKARILILENHDDFGGHAKRNEFHVNGRMELINGGTLEIDSPTPYSKVAGGLIKSLGIDPALLSKECDHPETYEKHGLSLGVFFDKESFGKDQLVVSTAKGRRFEAAQMKAFLPHTPFSEKVRKDILRIETGMEDYYPGLTSAQKKDRLSLITYKDYLLDVVKADPGVIWFYQHHTDEEWACGIDAVSAIDCWGYGMPGFQGLKLAPGATNRMGYTPAGYCTTGGSDTFHFPDGNASIARLLVRDLIPEAMPGHDARDVVTAKCDYAKLDRAGNPVRLRLNSLVVRARNVKDGVEIAYTRASGGAKVKRVRAKHCVLASWNMMIPYLCPEMPAEQKEALHDIVKAPLIYCNVALRNWQAFVKLKVERVYSPGSYWVDFGLNAPVDIGAYKSPRSPDEPILIRMVRTPAKPGLSEYDQNRAGRAELLATSFETFERHIRDQLGRSLSGGGFDPARDIEGIAVNRWPHGYAPEYSYLFDRDRPLDRQANLVGRKTFGNIAIANSDAGFAAYTDCAIDQAHRAVSELIG
ncbi:MAG TPA: NAD(P)-binding protein [Rhizomicrobium sp.]|nr:NAD(P)-binding protein [Rhizomicrobium sp.]